MARRTRVCRCPECSEYTPVEKSTMYGGKKRNLTTCARCKHKFDATKRYSWLEVVK